MEHETSSVATSLHSELSTTDSSSQYSTDLENYVDPDVLSDVPYNGYQRFKQQRRRRGHSMDESERREKTRRGNDDGHLTDSSEEAAAAQLANPSTTNRRHVVVPIKKPQAKWHGHVMI